MGVDRPPPLQRANRVASTFDALRAVPTRNFFAPQATKRLVVYLTDGESRVFSPRRMRAAFRAGKTGSLRRALLGARASASSAPTARPRRSTQADPASAEAVRDAGRRGRAAARSTRTSSTSARRRRREYVGEGDAGRCGEDSSRTTLAPYLFLGAFVPLGFLLWRRNF